MKEKNCAWCGTLFNYGRHKEKMFCSNECLSTYKAHPLTRHLKSIQTKEGFIKARGTTKQTQEQKDKIKKFWESKDDNYRLEHIEKTKNGKLEKYDDSFFFSKEKFKETSLLKYGVDHPLKVKEIKDKAKDTLKKKYGKTSFLGSESDLQERNEKYKEKLLDIFEKNNITLLDEYRGVFDEKKNFIRYNVKCENCQTIFDTRVGMIQTL